MVVDDDRLVLGALDRMLRSNGFHVEVFVTASALLDRAPDDGIGCVVLDLRMPDMSGLDVQQALAHRHPTLPIIFLSGVGDVPKAARAMRQGAVDFLVKPVDEPELLDAVTRAIERSARLRDRLRAERDATERMARLTKREREVCDLVARGLLNKQIAHALGTTEKTVKVHRGRVMQKLEVDSVAALVTLLAHLPPAGI